MFAPETAAHASGTSALLPMLALGIPGSGTAAILLGGLMVWGLNPGPLLFVEHKEFVWGLIASMYLGNVVGLVMVLTTVPLFAAVLRVPFAAIAPMIVVSCAIGAFAIQNAMFDIWLMLRLRRASATSSRRSASRWRRSRWRWCSAAAPRIRSGSR